MAWANLEQGFDGRARAELRTDHTHLALHELDFGSREEIGEHGSHLPVLHLAGYQLVQQREEDKPAMSSVMFDGSSIESTRIQWVIHWGPRNIS